MLQRNKKNNGFVLYLTVLLVGIFLVISLSIGRIVSKEIILSAQGRESQFAFYAADSGVECALFWDFRHPGFGDTIFATSSETGAGGVVNPVITCNGQDITARPPNPAPILGSDNALTEFFLDLPVGGCTIPDCPCVRIEVKKESSGIKTIVKAFGSNTCAAVTPLRVERAIRVQY